LIIVEIYRQDINLLFIMSLYGVRNIKSQWQCPGRYFITVY